MNVVWNFVVFYVLTVEGCSVVYMLCKMLLFSMTQILNVFTVI